MDFYRDHEKTEKNEGVPQPTAPTGKIYSSGKYTFENGDLIETILKNIELNGKEIAFTSWDSNGKMKSWSWAKFHMRAKKG
jgi:hypothetical protein